ncbi:hypothetical protein D9M72_149290 [compost metagenome]
MRPQQLTDQVRSVAFAQPCHAHATDVGKGNLTIRIDDEAWRHLHTSRVGRLRNHSTRIGQQLRVVVHDHAHDVTRPDGVASPFAKQRLHLRRHPLRRHLRQRTHQRQRDGRDFALRRFVRKVAELRRQLAARFVRLHRTHAGHHGTALEQHRAGKRYPREGFRISSQFRSLESQSVSRINNEAAKERQFPKACEARTSALLYRASFSNTCDRHHYAAPFM